MPVYCETWLYGYGSFPAEPINAATSLVPVALGALALYFLIRRREGGWAAPLLAVLLIFTGMGSTAWHATREQVALTADTMPGLAYFAVLTLLWVYYLGGRWLGVLPLAAIALLIHFLWPVSREALFIGLGAFTVTLAATLIYLTWHRRRAAFRLALATVGFAALALALRSIDKSVCDTIPIGTHFFWHIFLASAAYCGVRMMVRLHAAKAASVS
jgi:hypothetical protein